MKLPKTNEGSGLFKGVFTAYAILLLHLLLIAGLGLLVLFFRGFITYMIWVFLGGAAIILVSAWLFYRRLKSEGKNLQDVMNSPAFKGKSVEVSLMGGLASFRMGHTAEMPALEGSVSPPPLQLEDPNTLRIRELSELARLYENNLITLEEFQKAKANIFEP